MTQLDPSLPDPVKALAEDLDSAGPALVLSEAASQRLIDSALKQPHTRPTFWIKRIAAGKGRAVGIAALLLIGSSAAAAWYKNSSIGESNNQKSTMDGVEAPHGVPVPVPAEPSVPADPVSEVPPPEIAARPAQQTNDSESEDLLQKANRLRREGRPREAEQAYLQLVQQGPQTMPAYVARVAVAELQMARNAAGAIALLRAAQQRFPQGPLDIEIRQGLAQAYRATGNQTLERRELEQLIARHSSSLAAERARSRLSELARGELDLGQMGQDK